MKSLTLITLMLAATMAQAETYQVSCAVPEGQKIGQSFSGQGKLTVEDNGDSSASMTLAISGPEVSIPAVSEFFYGPTVTISDSYMKPVSYSFIGEAEHLETNGKHAFLKMYLNGPAVQASSQIIMDGAQYLSNCRIVQEQK